MLILEFAFFPAKEAFLDRRGEGEARAGGLEEVLEDAVHGGVHGALLVRLLR